MGKKCLKYSKSKGCFLKIILCSFGPRLRVSVVVKCPQGNSWLSLNLKDDQRFTHHRHCSCAEVRKSLKNKIGTLNLLLMSGRHKLVCSVGRTHYQLIKQKWLVSLHSVLHQKDKQMSEICLKKGKIDQNKLRKSWLLLYIQHICAIIASKGQEIIA